MAKQNNILLSQLDTRAPRGLDKEKTKQKMHAMLEEINGLQNLLFAENNHSLLVIIQGMDASGKD
ncbi:MAG TPA: polyphosphate kinase, partial [Chitinophagaceae bacterium]|nr:polyphosphate kinase [Chitinophagaceae bacterium]